MILLLQSLLASASATALVLDFDHDINTDLLSTSEYYIDKEANTCFSSIAKIPSAEWSPFDRDQLKFGFMDSPVWIRTNFQSIGKDTREIVFTLHKALNNIEMRVNKEGGGSQFYTFNKFIKPSEEPTSNMNTAKVMLEPNQTYQLIIKIDSASPIIGQFIAIEVPTLNKITAQTNQWVHIAIILIILISVYNTIVFASNRHPAVIAHLIYVLSILGYLLNDFGYIQKWAHLTELGTTQRISAIFLVISILSLVAFFRSMSSNQKCNNLFKPLYKCLFLAGYVIIPLMFPLPFQYALHLIFALIGLSIFIGIAHTLTIWKEISKVDYDDNSLTLTLTLLIVLITLVPSIVIHILSKHGIIDVIWYTEFVLFASVILEVILISVLLFFNIRKDKEAYLHEMYTNSLSSLPNDRALEKFFFSEPLPNNKTMIQVWISGLDELQIAYGPDLYKEFLTDAAIQMSMVLIDTPSVIKCNDSKGELASLFHSDKNTFTMLCSKADQATYGAIEEKLTNALETISHLHRNSIDLKIVLGAYEFDHSKTELNSAFVNCNLALAYSIKHNKKFKFYAPQMSFDESQRLTLINDFHQSLSNDEFFLLWQPQYDTQTSKIIGAEVLSRWQHEYYGLISPSLFIPLLEKSSRICELSHWVIDEVLNYLPELQERYPGIEISINLSPRDLIGNGLVEFLDGKLKSHANQTPFITFEITETLLIDDYSQVLKNVKRLQARHFKISIDDFGSGYTSFAYLQKLPANELKIDKIYTDSYLENSSNAILESIIFMAKRLNMRVVVEGIEHQQQIELFKRLGAERLQGWMLDKPMSIDALLNKGNSANHLEA